MFCVRLFAAERAVLALGDHAYYLALARGIRNLRHDRDRCAGLLQTSQYFVKKVSLFHYNRAGYRDGP